MARMHALALSLFFAVLAVWPGGPSAAQTETVEGEARALLREGRTDEALRLLRGAAERKDHSALGYLGYLYASGTGVAQDLAKAARYWKAAAELGDTVAQVDYARLLVEGRGVTRDVQEGMSLLQGAANEGERLAHLALGELYFYPGDPISFDLDAALRWFESARKLGEPLSARPIGEILLFAGQVWGRPELIDCERGEALLREALLRNEDYVANLGLGWAYYDGLTCEFAPKKAVPFFRAAETHRIDGSARALGVAFVEEVAVPRERLTAVHWFALALQRGDEEARAWLDWTIAGLQPRLSLEELRRVRGLRILLDGGEYTLPEGIPAKPELQRG